MQLFERLQYHINELAKDNNSDGNSDNNKPRKFVFKKNLSKEDNTSTPPKRKPSRPWNNKRTAATDPAPVAKNKPRKSKIVKKTDNKGNTVTIITNTRLGKRGRPWGSKKYPNETERERAERIRKQRQSYYQNNKSTRDQYHSNWVKDNSPRNTENQKNWREAHKDQISTYNKNYYQNNKSTKWPYEKKPKSYKPKVDKSWDNDYDRLNTSYSSYDIGGAKNSYDEYRKENPYNSSNSSGKKKRFVIRKKWKRDE